MATVGGCNGEDINVESVKEWPLTYERERKEYMCGFCGQALVSNHTAEDLETHFKSCENNKENGHSMIFEELRKLTRNFEALKADVQVKVDEIKTEVKEDIRIEINNVKAEFGKELETKKTNINTKILDLQSNIEKQLETKNEGARVGVLPTLFWKIKTLEEKITEVNGRVSGVTETISTAVRSVLEAKGSSSAETILINELDRTKKETESLREQLKKSERDIQSIKTQLEGEIAQLKTGAETFVEQLKTNDGALRAIKAQLEDEKAKNISLKEMSFHVEPSLRDQFAIPINCFNLVSHTYLFQPSFKWTIGEIDTIIAQKTFELSSELFQWNGYPVQARAKLQLKEDEFIYVSLSLKDRLKDARKLKDFKPIPPVFYLLKDKFTRNPKHTCQTVSYLLGCDFNNSLKFDRCLVHKSWLSDSSYNVKNSVDIEIYVEPSQMAQLVHSYDGTLEWNIESYKRRLEIEKDGLVAYQESPCFYTSPRGYRVQVGICLIGTEGKGPTVYVMFLTGKFDAELPKSFAHCTTVTLVNRKDPKRSIKKTVVEDIQNQKAYAFEVCKVEDVADLIINDSLFCKVIIKSHN